MTLDSALLAAFLSAFLRTSAMVFASPLFTGTGTPVIVRVMFSMVLSLAIVPLLYGQVAVPDDLHGLAMAGGYEIAVGLLIGFIVQTVLYAAQVAGSFLDMQVGLGLGAAFAPNQALPATVISKFKFMMATILFISLNGHHLLISAVVGSYDAAAQLTLATGMSVVMTAVVQMSLIGLQIALPVAAVSFVVDACLGIVSRAVPQINVLMAAISGKLLAGMIALSLSLPALAIGVDRALGLVQELLVSLLRQGSV